MTIRDRVRCRGGAAQIYGGKKETLRGNLAAAAAENPAYRAPYSRGRWCAKGLQTRGQENHHIHEDRVPDWVACKSFLGEQHLHVTVLPPAFFSPDASRSVSSSDSPLRLN